MPVRVRIQNFQSIEDETVTIDGLTVITGPNNSGKTSIMRAVRGVFTNAPAGPLVRHGAAHLTVTLTFDDGTVIIWEKGWEKPGRKGKTVNRYTINGKELPTVGRGSPSEVEALGVCEIQAASDRVWPQIASQFDGTLFLINRPGSSVAEALSDVEKVGQLTKALKRSEKDRRSAVSELKVRRKDKKTYKDAVDQFAGLDDVRDQIKGLSKDTVQKPYQSLLEARVLQGKLLSSREEVQALEGFDPSALPESDRTQDLREARTTLVDTVKLSGRYQSARATVDALEGFVVQSPDATKVQQARATLKATSDLRQKLQAVRGESQKLREWSEPSFPDPVRVTRLREAVGRLSDFRDRHQKARDLVASLASSEEQAEAQAQEAEAMVRTALGERGLCPTCQTVHEGSHA